MLEVNGISFFYKPERMILEDITFQVNKGDILCLLGPNGTGKTTLLRCLLGFGKMKSGSIRIDGKEMSSSVSPRRRARMMAYVPQSSGITFPYEAFEVVLMGRLSHLSLGGSPTEKDRSVARESMERMGILELEHTLFQELSGGERQMVLVARALAQQSDILVMDEPTANLDYGNQVKMLRVIKKLSAQGYTVLMTSHFPEHAFLACSRVVMMQDGYIMAQGTPEEVVTSDSLSALYQTPVRVTETDINMDGHAVKVCVPLML
ncbi:ABC transporter ATP-binding protein [Lacrimispora sp.]|uniref:ABC transporter ATP-binding protein n=1 Tax=Lacrimispora sp. TaxID=2719234 RepID=UPI0028A63804|nr:ABC transporter ATP-binding protein [Lacrimispora sp.]